MYDHYIAVDWAQRNMAIARMTAKSNEIKTIDTKADVSDLRAYLKNIVTGQGIPGDQLLRRC